MSKLNQRGSSLLEIMIAVSLFAIGMAALLTVITQCKVMAKRAETAHTAYNLAKNHIERLRLYPFASLSSAAETGTTINGSDVPDPSGLFTRITSVTTSYLGNSSLTQATVTIQYTVRGVQNASQCQLSYVFFNYSGAVG